MRLPLLLITMTVLGCRQTPPTPPPGERAQALERALEIGVVQPAPLERATLPSDWQEIRWPDCSDWLGQHFPDGRLWTLPGEDLRALSGALARADESSLRAIQILARLSDPLASEICVAHLERRLSRSQQWPLAEVVDTICARALGSMADFAGMGPRLEQLATGSNPHHSVDVRVECAIRALALDKRRALDFLLAFSKLGTHLSARGANVAPGTDVAQAQLRAFEALLAYSGIDGQVSLLDAIEQREALLKSIEAALANRNLRTP
jgi:hypothetical protein